MDTALIERGTDIAKGWAASLTMGVGQFCTNPGIVVLSEGSEADQFIETAQTELEAVAGQPMLNNGIAKSYRAGQSRLEGNDAVTTKLSVIAAGRKAGPALFTTTAKAWFVNPELGDEVFGPLGIVVTTNSFDEVVELAKSLEGQLTCTLFVDDADVDAAAQLMPVLERKAGRVLANGYPTGVEVCDAMVHGGPYPASTNFGATSVGSMAIRRFLRPVCYQNLPEALLPDAG